MHRRAYGVGLLIALVVMPRFAVAQATAYVRAAEASNARSSGDHGNAILFSRGDACYAVTPLHVLRNEVRGTQSDYAQLVVARVGAAAIQAQGDLCAVMPEIDLALLRVSGVQRAADCGGPLLGAPSTDGLLSTNAGAWLGTTSESGRVVGSALVKRALSSGEADSFYASPAASQDRLTEGMSGSLVSIKDQPVGMLLSVSNRSDDPNAGAARILRLDGMATRIGRLFASRTDAETVNAACFQQADTSPATSGGGKRIAAGGPSDGNLASATCGARPSAWSTAPMSADDRPENLVGSGSNKLWRVPASGEISIDIRLCPSTTGTVATLGLDTSSCGSGDNQAYDVEALVRSAPQGAFATLSFGHLPPNGRLNLDAGAPLKGNEVRLRFVVRSRSASSLCLAPIVVR